MRKIPVGTVDFELRLPANFLLKHSFIGNVRRQHIAYKALNIRKAVRQLFIFMVP